MEIKMITAEERQTRRKFIGGSDVSAICGKDPWRSAFDVYLSKIQEIEDKPNEAMGAGNRLESPVLDWAEAEIGKKLIRGRRYESGILAVNLDAELEDGTAGVEAKTTGIIGPGNPDEWGDEGSDDVPAHVIIQCQTQMLVKPSFQAVYVPALIGGRGFCLFLVERQDKIIRSIKQRCEDFWHTHVIPMVPPSDCQPSLDIVRRIRRDPGSVIQIPAGPVDAWLKAKEAAKEADAAKENAEAVMLAFLGTAEAADSPLGRITFLEQEARRLDQTALKKDHPDIADHYTYASKYRVLRHKAPKGAKVS